MTELRALLERLVQMLDSSGVPFMIAGSFASTAHGLLRTTQDLDVVIDPPTPQALDALVGSMSPDDYYVDVDAARDALRRRSMFNVIDHASGWKVDFIVRKNRAFSRDEFARRMQLTLLDVPVFVASPEDRSERQRRDVAGIVATMGEQLDRAYIDRRIGQLGLEEEWAIALKTSA